jgi:hypothetical protein
MNSRHSQNLNRQSDAEIADILKGMTVLVMLPFIAPLQKAAERKTVC